MFAKPSEDDVILSIMFSLIALLAFLLHAYVPQVF